MLRPVVCGDGESRESREARRQSAVHEAVERRRKCERRRGREKARRVALQGRPLQQKGGQSMLIALLP
jgi:hypothetical protein